MSLMIHSIISSRKAELDQFAQGLEPLLREARKVSEMFKPLFVYGQDTKQLTPECFKALIDSDCLEDNLKEYLDKYIDSKGTCIFLLPFILKVSFKSCKLYILHVYCR